MLNKQSLKKKWHTCPSKINFAQFGFFILVFIGSCGNNIKKTSQLKIVSSSSYYKKQIVLNPNFTLLDIKKNIPSIVLDIRYATKNNFSGIAVYKRSQAYARKPVVMALQKIQQSLAKQGLGLKIYDAYRPYRVTVKFWNITPNNKKEFVANPAKGSRHNRGCAVDITLIDLKTGNELAMPTPYDSFLNMAYADYASLPKNVLKNREILQKVMTNNGFKIFKAEWWHFDFEGWEAYDLMNIEFENLEKLNPPPPIAR